MRAHRFLLAAAVGAAVIAPLGRADLPLPPVATAPAAKADARTWSVRQSPVVDVVKRVKDAVVNIHSERTVQAGGVSVEELFALAPSQNRVNGMGTGIVIDPRGYILTNQHVVDDVSSLRVRLSDGTVLNASVLARDPETDLALLKIAPAKPLPVLPPGTAKDLQVGETVVAVGNAYGYDHTVTVGVVSAVGRDVTLNKDMRYRALIQTDAAINPGNSGGPLINLNGELVGVNVAIRAGAQGIGFAIPVDSAITVAGAMLTQVRARQGIAGLGLATRDDVAGAAGTRQVVVDRVDAGAASQAGLQKGDLVVKAGEQEVTSSLDLHRALVGKTAGDKVEIVVRRDGAAKALTLQLPAGAAADSRPRAALTSTAGHGTASNQVWRQLGVRLTVVSKADVARGHQQLNGGLQVSEVRDNSPASRAGLRVGDILVGLHQWEMLKLDNVLYVLNHADRATFTPLRFYILRAGTVHRGWATPAE